MDSRKVSFKVAMDKEQAELKNYTEVEFLVEFPEDCHEQLVTDALKSQIIKWQGQIRNNWDKFLKDGPPEKMVYGSPIYGQKRGVRAPTKEELEKMMAEKITSLTPEGLQEFIKSGKFPEGEEYYK